MVEVRCQCPMAQGKVVSLCPAHQEYFRQLRAMEQELAEGWPGGPEVVNTKNRPGPKFLTYPISDTRRAHRAGRHKPPRKRRPGTTPTTDAIATIAVGAGVGTVAYMAPLGAFFPYLLWPSAAFLVVVGCLNLMLDRKG